MLQAACYTSAESHWTLPLWRMNGPALNRGLWSSLESNDMTARDSLQKTMIAMLPFVRRAVTK